MKKQNTIQVLLPGLLILFTSTALLHADIYMKQKRHTDGFSVMGQNQPAEDVIEETWLTENGFRSDSPDHSMIMMFDKQKMIMLNHEEKTYMEMPMNFEETFGDETDEEESQALQGMMSNMGKMDISVQKTGKTKVLHGWKCKNYILTMKMFMGTTEMDIWATEDLKIDPTLYSKFSAALGTSNPAMQGMAGDLSEKMKEIKGVQILSVSTQNIMNQKVSSSTELLEFKTGKAPGNLFKIPAGYKKTNPR